MGSDWTSRPVNSWAVCPPSTARWRSSGRYWAPSAVMAAYRVLVPRRSKVQEPSGASRPAMVKTKASPPGKQHRRQSRLGDREETLGEREQRWFLTTERRQTCDGHGLGTPTPLWVLW